MTHSDYGKVPTYSGMLIGGGFAVAAGGIGLSILLTVGITTKMFLPTGFASLTMGAAIIGVLLLVGRMNLRKTTTVGIDAVQSTTAIFDELRAIRDEIAQDRDDLADVAEAALKLAEEQAKMRSEMQVSGEALADITKAAVAMADRQDEILALLAQQAQRYDHTSKQLAAAIEALAERVSSTEEDIGDLVADVRKMQHPSLGTVSMLPKKRVDPPASGKID